MKKSVLYSITLSIIFSLFACTSSVKKSDTSPEIKNIILLIGDGMGLANVSAALTVSSEPLNFERFNFIGFSRTQSLTDYITDSAAGGIALSSGVKTKNGVLGQNTSGNNFRSILELAEDNGLSTGIVSTSSVTHATPASFISHNNSRYNYEEIALDFLKTDIDIFIGGGIDHFFNRSDGLNLWDSLIARGYEVDTTLDAVLSSSASKIAGLTASVHNPYQSKGRGDMLSKSSEKAIDILSKNPAGFFLMIEGSQIDWGGHANDQLNTIQETLDFDKAIGKALDFAEKDGHTLVIVTADHETGGISITGGNEELHSVELTFSTKGHTGIMVPVYAFGPGAENFGGIYENTSIFDKMKKLLGL
ncbi:MAG: alkaline phosphatase [Bacteroidales bacterium]|nr:alkaline phosphatase [Bacteroidales bacterium]MCB9013877.1 alkaline phosphatase [Bacteroidales bacterium]